MHHWQKIKVFRDGHSYFHRDGKHNRLYLADQSGSDPEKTHDGPLYVDRSRPITISSDTTRWIPLLTDGGKETETACDEDEARWVGNKMQMSWRDNRGRPLQAGPKHLPKDAPPITLDDLRTCWPLPSLFKTTLAYSWAASDINLHWSRKDCPPLDKFVGEAATEHDLIEAARHYRSLDKNHPTGAKLAQLAGYLAEPTAIEHESPESYRNYRHVLAEVLVELHDAMKSPSYRCNWAGEYERDRKED